MTGVVPRFGQEAHAQAVGLQLVLPAEAGYDPRHMIEVMKILAESGGGSRQPEFFSTHPNPENRIANIEAAIREASSSRQAQAR
jgi:predicted Zn-dependent protease